MHFQYLGGLGPCAGSRRETVLRQAVLTILAGKDPAGSDPPTGRALGAPAPTSGEAGSERGTQFRRLYLALRIADQRYYEARHQEYQAAHDQAVTVRNLLLLLAAVLAAIGQVVSESDRPPWSAVAAVLGALAGLVTAYETLIGFTQLAQVYADAAAALVVAEIDWTSPTDGLAEQVERVESIISRENGQWGQLAATAPESAPPPCGDGG